MAKNGDSRSVIMAAMIGNAGIAIAKLVALALSGSVTMLAEAVHSLLDTANQGLLLLGLAREKRRQPCEASSHWRQREGYFWAFIGSLMLFFVGGVFSVYRGIERFKNPTIEYGNLRVCVIVLVIAIVLDGGSFMAAIREFNKERGQRKLSEALFHGQDPTIPVLLIEDTGAMLGLVIALVSTVLTWLTGNATIDAVGSIVIGLLLCAIGVLLAHDTRSLLVGEELSKEGRDEIEAIVSATPGVERLTQFLSMQAAPNSGILALKVRFQNGLSRSEVEARIVELETRIRGRMPQLERIFVEPESDELRSDNVA